MAHYIVRPLYLDSGNWIDCPTDKATHFGVNADPDVADELIMVLDSQQDAADAAARLNEHTRRLLESEAE